MIRVSAYRANRILFNFIRANAITGTTILPVNICPSVVETLQYVGMQVRFVDINLKTLCMDTVAAMEAISEASLLIYVHTYGVDATPDAFFAELKKRKPGLYIVDDKCLCIPQLDAAKHEQSAADMILYSLGPKKFVVMEHGALGFVSDKCNYEEVVENEFFEPINYTFDEAEVSARKEQMREYKCKLNTIYRNHIPYDCQYPEAYQNWRFNIRVDNKTEIMQALSDNGLFASGHYKPLAEGCPNATDLYEHVINLFNDTYYTEEQAMQTCPIINQILKKHISQYDEDR